jgi:copper chaperone CopZ
VRTARIQIEGMSCGHCVARVKGALQGLAGVEVDDVAIGEARFRYDPEAVDRERITETIEETGFVPADIVEG